MTGKLTPKFQLFILIVFVASAVFLRFWQYHYSSIVVNLNGRNLNVLVAKTEAQKYRGLGGRKNLGQYDGMIFVFEEYDRYGIVMRDMLFPIDIIWLKDGMVVDFYPNAPLESGVPETQLRPYYPRSEANAVLELRSGWAKEAGLQIGSRLSVVEN